MSNGSWDTTQIYGNYIETLWNTARPSGTSNSYVGPDGINTGDGASIHDNYFVVHKTSNSTSAQHPNALQLAGANIKVYNNIFENIGD